MTEFRQRLSRQTWHWREDCRYWPTVNYKRHCRADGGKLCENCIHLHARDAMVWPPDGAENHL